MLFSIFDKYSCLSSPFCIYIELWLIWSVIVGPCPELCLSFSFSKEFDRILLHGLAVAVGCAQLHTFCRLNNKDKINDFIFLVEAQSDWTTSREHKISKPQCAICFPRSRHHRHYHHFRTWSDRDNFWPASVWFWGTTLGWCRLCSGVSLPPPRTQSSSGLQVITITITITFTIINIIIKKTSPSSYSWTLYFGLPCNQLVLSS